MKKVFFTLTACALFTTVVNANNNPKSTPVAMAAYRTGDAAGVKVIVVNSASENVTVKIKDATGKVVHTDIVRNIDKFSRKYVFANDMQSGDYTIEVINSQGVASQLVTL